jgi:DNA-binding NtrC family response regulator
VADCDFNYACNEMMKEKNIVLFERYDGVRFVLERSLSKIPQEIEIFTSHWKEEIKQQIKTRPVDLLITELSKFNSDGLEISHFARKISPNMRIIWITVQGCHNFRTYKDQLGNISCIEKPLEIKNFRQKVLNALGADQ